MGKGRHATVFNISQADKETLQRWIRDPKSPVWLVRRAQSLLLLAQGKPSSVIVEETHTSRETLFKWRKRYLKWGVYVLRGMRQYEKYLQDQYRSNKANELTTDSGDLENPVQGRPVRLIKQGKVQMGYSQKRAKVVGLIITECPACGNAINFDRRDIKVCPYCGTEAHIDLNNVQVTVWAEAEGVPPPLTMDAELSRSKRRSS
ncbi:MAG: helix-turn-helix domain-containing protein [Bacteroidota bacterium]